MELINLISILHQFPYTLLLHFALCPIFGALTHWNMVSGPNGNGVSYINYYALLFISLHFEAYHFDSITVWHKTKVESILTRNETNENSLISQFGVARKLNSFETEHRIELGNRKIERKKKTQPEWARKTWDKTAKWKKLLFGESFHNFIYLNFVSLFEITRMNVKKSNKLYAR